ncbi:MAG: hypothetical protein AAGD07_07550 [Planctomycetota bacterium]
MPTKLATGRSGLSPCFAQVDPSDIFSEGNSTSRVYADVGALLSESACEVPAFYHRSQRKIKRIGSYNSRLETQWKCDLQRNCEPPTGSSGNHMYMQSTLGWAAMHTGSSGYAAQFLFADGSVRIYSDINGDLFLNPGFPVPDDLSEEQYTNIGYRDNTVELPTSSFFSGVFLTPSTIKGVFED